MSLEGDQEMIMIERFPRVSGDEPIRLTGLKTLDRFSPRERG